METAGASPIQQRLVDSLYVEAMLLADEARGYFDEVGRDDREMLEAMTRVAFSCESLKVTTRLMHVIAWLLTQRAVHVGEIARRDALDPSRRLGGAPETDASALLAMPPRAQALIEASLDLYRRVARLDRSQVEFPQPAASPARSMIERLASAF